MADGDVAAKPHFMIISSMKFAEDIVAKRGVLETLGYAVSVPNDTDLMLSTPTLLTSPSVELYKLSGLPYLVGILKSNLV